MATISHSHGDEDWSASGDATEIALQVFAHKLGHGKPHLTHPPRAPKLTQVRSRDSGRGASQNRNMARTASHMGRRNSTADGQAKTGEATLSPPKATTQGAPVARAPGHYEMLVEHSFDSTVKRMTTAWRFLPEDGSDTESHVLVFMKGAVERTLDRCDFVGLDSSGPKLDDDARENITARMDLFAEEGLRVLALCGRREPIARAQELIDMPRDDIEKGFGFLGLVGI
jgi:magnesium-transporting ATPase (P-type)